MKKILIALLVGGALAMTGCTAKEAAKSFGGSYTLELPADKKLIEVTWKENDLWYLIRDMRPDEQPEIYTFQEDSNYGIMEGKVTIVEKKRIK